MVEVIILICERLFHIVFGIFGIFCSSTMLITAFIHSSVNNLNDELEDIRLIFYQTTLKLLAILLPLSHLLTYLKS